MFKHGFPPEWSTLKKLIWLVGSGIAGAASGIWKTVTGTLLHITDALASPVKELSVAIEPQQSGSGDPSPDNVRPITGWTGCNIRRTGKNLFDKTNISENNRYIKSDGSLVSNSSWVVSSYIHVKAGETYTLSNYQDSNTSAPGVRYYGNDGGIVGFSYGSTRTKTFTVPNGALTMRISVMASLIDSCQLELGSTATTHEDYQGTTYPISWQTETGTVYGGTLDAVNGTLTVTDAEIASYNGETLPSTWISDRDVYAVGTTPTIGAQVVYKLATPTEIQLTPQEITTLAGENNIWADANGEITLTYQAVPETAFSDNADTGMADYMTLTE